MTVNDATIHWRDMPEFTQEAQKPFAMINMRFETEQDLVDFMTATGLTLTAKTKSAWFPAREKSKTGMKRWL